MARSLGAEAAEDVRTNLRMIKLNYILPDFLKTANNELEGFIIPGDFEGQGIETQADPRNPYAVPAAFGGGCVTAAQARMGYSRLISIRAARELTPVSCPTLTPRA